MEHKFKALQVIESGGKFERKIVTLTTKHLPVNDILIKVNYSSINYKDALSVSGNRGITRKYPHVPGIDAAGEVVSTSSTHFNIGDKVLVTGFDLGMNTWGGFGEYISVPHDWVLHLPEGLSEKEAMSLGTAGLTAGLSVHKLVSAEILPVAGKIVVSGASGGVGSIAVSILTKLGYEVTVVTGKPDKVFLIDTLGAKEIIQREEFTATFDQKPIGVSHFAAGIDTVSGPVLSSMLKSVKYGGAVTCCGMVASADLHTSIFPFILRGIQLIGVDSVQTPISERKVIWNKLSSEWKPDKLAEITREISLESLPEELDRMLDGQAKGRVILKHQD